jgi:hypothetical protein
MQNASLPQTCIQLKAVSMKYYYSMYIHCNYFACKSNALLHIMFDHLWPTWLCLDFHNDLINGMILGKKIIIYDICILILAKLSYENLLYSRRIRWDIIVNVPRTSSIMSTIFIQL